MSGYAVGGGGIRVQTKAWARRVTGANPFDQVGRLAYPLPLRPFGGASRVCDPFAGIEHERPEFGERLQARLPREPQGSGFIAERQAVGRTPGHVNGPLYLLDAWHKRSAAPYSARGP